MKRKQTKLKPERRFKLRQEFEAMGLRTYQEIAVATGLSRDHVARVMCGWSFPGVETQEAFKRVLGISEPRLSTLL